jgi:hypothetical protein
VSSVRECHAVLSGRSARHCGGDGSQSIHWKRSSVHASSTRSRTHHRPSRPPGS